MRKRIILITIIGLLLLVLPLMANADTVASGSCGSDLTWTLDENGMLTISGTGSMDSNPWTKDAINQVIIEYGATSICDYAFTNCTNLTSISIPNSVSSIGYSAFNSCYLLSDLILPESIISIDEDAFYNCDSLTHIIIPSSKYSK